MTRHEEHPERPDAAATGGVPSALDLAVDQGARTAQRLPSRSSPEQSAESPAPRSAVPEPTPAGPLGDPAPPRYLLTHCIHNHTRGCTCGPCARRVCWPAVPEPGGGETTATAEGWTKNDQPQEPGPVIQPPVCDDASRVGELPKGYPLDAILSEWGDPEGDAALPATPDAPDGKPWGWHSRDDLTVTGTHTRRGESVTVSDREYHALCRAVTERGRLRAALLFYSDPSIYDVTRRTVNEWATLVEGPAITRDCGQRAMDALDALELAVDPSRSTPDALTPPSQPPALETDETRDARWDSLTLEPGPERDAARAKLAAHPAAARREGGESDNDAPASIRLTVGGLRSLTEHFGRVVNATRGGVMLSREMAYAIQIELQDKLRALAAAPRSGDGETTITPVDQTTFGAPEGNCLMACVATLTGIPLAALDDLFAAECQNDGAHWWDLFTAALHLHGWHPVYISGEDGVTPTGYAIGSGVSPRGFRHAVVVKEGRLTHDPHPSRAGVETVDGFYVLLPASAALPLRPAGDDHA